MVSRISHLTCTSCGTDQRVKIEQTEGGELCSPCNACGGRGFAAWPRLEMPTAPVFDFAEVPTERLNEFLRAVFGEYKDDE